MLISGKIGVPLSRPFNNIFKAGYAGAGADLERRRQHSAFGAAQALLWGKLWSWAGSGAGRATSKTVVESYYSTMKHHSKESEDQDCFYIGTVKRKKIRACGAIITCKIAITRTSGALSRFGTLEIYYRVTGTVTPPFKGSCT